MGQQANSRISGKCIPLCKLCGQGRLSRLYTVCYFTFMVRLFLCYQPIYTGNLMKGLTMLDSWKWILVSENKSMESSCFYQDPAMEWPRLMFERPANSSVWKELIVGVHFNILSSFETTRIPLKEWNTHRFYLSHGPDYIMFTLKWQCATTYEAFCEVMGVGVGSQASWVGINKQLVMQARPIQVGYSPPKPPALPEAQSSTQEVDIGRPYCQPTE